MLGFPHRKTIWLCFEGFVEFFTLYAKSLTIVACKNILMMWLCGYLNPPNSPPLSTFHCSTSFVMFEFQDVLFFWNASLIQKDGLTTSGPILSLEMSFCEASGVERTEKDETPPQSFFRATFFIFPSSPIRLLQLSTPNNGILVSRVTPGGLLGRRFDYVPAIFFCRPRKKPKKSSSTRNQNCLSMALLTQKAPKGPLNRKSTDESSTLLFVRLESVGLSRWRQRMWRHDDAASKKKTSAEYCFFVLCLSLLLLFELLYSYVYLLMYIHVLRPV